MHQAGSAMVEVAVSASLTEVDSAKAGAVVGADLGRSSHASSGCKATAGKGTDVRFPILRMVVRYVFFFNRVLLINILAIARIF